MDRTIRYSRTVRSVKNRSAADLAFAALQSGTAAWQEMNSYRRQQTSTVLDGDVDPRFKYTLVDNDLVFGADDAPYWQVPFLHGLGYRPVVDGTVYYERLENIRHPLPWTVYHYIDDGLHVPEPGFTVAIEDIDDLYIYVRFAVFSSDGLSLLGQTGGDFVFKFYCRSDTTI